MGAETSLIRSPAVPGPEGAREVMNGAWARWQEQAM